MIAKPCTPFRGAQVFAIMLAPCREAGRAGRRVRRP